MLGEVNGTGMHIENRLCPLPYVEVLEDIIKTVWTEQCGNIEDKSLVSNYRPVSLTSVISKVMETLVRNNIMEHLINEKLLADAQHGFVSGRSCVRQLIETREEWTHA